MHEPTPALGPDFAHFVAGRTGAAGAAGAAWQEAAVSGEVAAELAPLLELHLRETICLAIRLAKRARRRRLHCADIVDAAVGLCASSARCRRSEGAPYRELLARSPAASASASRLLEISSAAAVAQPLPPVPRALGLRVQWLAVDGSPVAGCDGPGSSLLSLGPSRARLAALASPLAAAPLAAAPSETPFAPSEEQLLLVGRLSSALEGDGGEGTQSVEEVARWRDAALELCAREALAPLRPLVADRLGRRAVARASCATSMELHRLLDAIEGLALASPEAQPHLRQCLFAATVLLCAPSASGAGGAGAARTGVRRRAAALVAEVVRRHCEEAPGLLPDMRGNFGEVLHQQPPAGAAAGAVFGLVALGRGGVEDILLPALRAGALDHLRLPTTAAANGADPDDAGRSELFDALAAAAADAATPLGAAVTFCEASAALFGTDATPLLAAALAARLPPREDATIWMGPSLAACI